LVQTFPIEGEDGLRDSLWIAEIIGPADLEAELKSCIKKR
tara:strand:- start:351 stop:470 length:120 start_codon:yes stop_codon:yes gene_type:complete